MNRARLQQGGLYVITDPGLLPDEQLLPAVAAALRGGAGLVQYRDKSRHAARRQQQVAALLQLCREHGALLLINDDVALAAAVGADGVHLGRDDMTVEQARDILGPDAIIGVSGYADPFAILQPQADYVAFGRLFPSRTKPTALPATLDVLRQARRLDSKPIVAIGGINSDNALSVRRAGANWLAVVEAVFGGIDVEQRARTLCRRLDEKL